MISSAAFAADSDSEILVSALFLTSCAVLISLISIEVEVVDEGKFEVEVEVDDEIGGAVEVVDEVVDDEIGGGVEVADDGGCGEDSVGQGLEGAKHVASKPPLAKQNVSPG